MSMNRTLTASRLRLARPANPSCRGGASSLLRLAQPALPKLPSGAELSGWVSRAANVLALAER